jgi:glutamate dehydrogenase (NAD(P)+)
MPLEARETDGQRIYSVDLDSGVLGFIVIDSTIGGRARGGLRMVEDASEAEVQAAARAMTLKYGFLGLPQGGAKAALGADGEASVAEKRERLREFADAVAPLLRERVYVPDTDLGTRAEDIRWMLESIGVRGKRGEWRSHRSGYFTAASCLASVEALMRRQGTSLAGRRVAIEGFGNVGSPLADLMRRRGAAVVAISTSRGALYHPKGLDVNRLSRLSAEVGSSVVEHYDDAESLDRGELLELPVDVLCPCARYHSIQESNALRVEAPVVCAGANDPVSPAAERILFERGVTFPPDFITNCGGVLGSTLEFAAVRPARIASLIERHVGDQVSALLEQAERERVPPRALAEPLALARHERVREASEHPTLLRRALSLGLEGYRRGWVPKTLVSLLTPRYVERLLGE